MPLSARTRHCPQPLKRRDAPMGNLQALLRLCKQHGFLAADAGSALDLRSPKGSRSRPRVTGGALLRCPIWRAAAEPLGPVREFPRIVAGSAVASPITLLTLGNKRLAFGRFATTTLGIARHAGSLPLRAVMLPEQLRGVAQPHEHTCGSPLPPGTPMPGWLGDSGGNAGLHHRRSRDDNPH